MINVSIMTSVTSQAQQYSQWKCVWRDESSDDCGKQAVTVQTWRGVADCSRLARRQPGKLGRGTSTAAYGVQPEMVTRSNVDDVWTNKRETAVGTKTG